MNRFLRVISLLTIGLIFSGVAFAHSYKLGLIQIGHCWMLPNEAGKKETMGFIPLALLPEAKEKTALEKIESADAGKIEIRRTLDNGKTETLDKLEIEPGKPVAMRAGALNVVITGLKKDYADKDRLRATLTFSNNQKIDVDFIVSAANPHEHG